VVDSCFVARRLAHHPGDTVGVKEPVATAANALFAPADLTFG
jgi:hypothetical protein